MRLLAILSLVLLPLFCSAQFNLRLGAGYNASSSADHRTVGNSNGYIGELKLSYAPNGFEIGALGGIGEMQSVSYAHAGLFANKIVKWAKIDGIFGVSLRRTWGREPGLPMDGMCFGTNVGADYKINKRLAAGAETGIYYFLVQRIMYNGSPGRYHVKQGSDAITMLPLMLTVKYRL